jgi:DNA-directed RNA polymerase specialized sigma24 family protein
MTPAGSPRFDTTRWSIVVAAGGGDSPAMREALATLCRTYWYPLYAFARRRGHDPNDAADLVQGFFVELLTKGWVGDADQERGRFRSFLLTAFTRFAGKERRRDAAQKRGGGVALLSLDFDDGESRFQAESTSALEPERAFERRWALTLLARALDRTRREFDDGGRGDLFAAVVPLIGGAGDVRPLAEIAESLGMSEGAVKVAVHRLRARYGEHVRDEIRDTVRSESDVEDEIRRLMDAVASG